MLEASVQDAHQAVGQRPERLMMGFATPPQGVVVMASTV